MSAHSGEVKSVDAFQAGTRAQVVDILTAVIHATSGFLSAFAKVHDCKPLLDAERELFKRMYRTVIGKELSDDASSPKVFERD